jgi:hypothetical protein
MINRFAAILLSVIVIVASACSDDDSPATEPIALGLDYFPTDSGLIRTYLVDSSYWNDFTGTTGTVSYLIREVQAGFFTDLQGRQAVRLERYRLDTLGNWTIDRVWSAVRTNQRAEVTEENNRFVKLIFPPDTESEWNGNAYNILGEEPYQYTRLGADTAAGQTFQKTAEVIQGDGIGNLIELRYGIEKYASNTGRIFRKRVDLEFSLPNRDTLAGFIYTERLISFER